MRLKPWVNKFSLPRSTINMKLLSLLPLCLLTLCCLQRAYSEDLPSESEASLSLLKWPKDQIWLTKDSNYARGTLNKDQPFSLDFPDAKIREVLLKIAELYDLNLKIPDDLLGSTAIKLRDVTWQLAFKVTLYPAGYSFVEREDRIQVLTTEDFQSLPLEPLHYGFFYVSPTDFMEYIGQYHLREEFHESYEVNVSTNSVTLMLHPSHKLEYLQYIEKADTPMSFQRFPKKIYWPPPLPPELLERKPPYTSSNPEHLDTQVFIIEWVNVIQLAEKLEESHLLPKDGNRIQRDLRSNALVITASKQDIAAVQKLISFLDHKEWYRKDTAAKLLSDYNK